MINITTRTTEVSKCTVVRMQLYPTNSSDACAWVYADLGLCENINLLAVHEAITRDACESKDKAVNDDIIMSREECHKCRPTTMASGINIYSVFWISKIIILDIQNNYFGYPK